VNRVANDDEQLILPISAEQADAEATKAAKKMTARKAAPAASGEDGQGSLF
jgi:hypothetical protein